MRRIHHDRNISVFPIGVHVKCKHISAVYWQMKLFFYRRVHPRLECRLCHLMVFVDLHFKCISTMIAQNNAIEHHIVLLPQSIFGSSRAVPKMDSRTKWTLSSGKFVPFLWLHLVFLRANVLHITFSFQSGSCWMPFCFIVSFSQFSVARQEDRPIH